MDLEVTEVALRTEREVRARGARFARAAAAALAFALVTMGLAAVAHGERSTLEVLLSFLAVAAASTSAFLGLVALVALRGAGGAEDGHHGSGTITVAEDGVVVGADGSRYPKASIDEGHVDERGRAVLRVRGRGDLAITCRAPEDAPRIIEMLGLGAGARTATFSVQSSAAQRKLGGVAAICTFFCALLGALFAAAAVGAGLAVAGVGQGEPSGLYALLAASLAAIAALGAWRGVRALSRRTVRVGTDGVTIDEARSRFIPFGEVVRVREVATRVLLDLRSGATEILATVPGEHGLGRRIAEAKATRGRSGVAAEAGLAPGARPLPEWRADLAKLLRESADYRDASVTSEDLAAVAEDGAQPAQRRIGAALALALAAAPEPVAKERVRVAAQAIGDRELREALEEAAEGEVAPRRLRRLAEK